MHYLVSEAGQCSKSLNQLELLKYISGKEKDKKFNNVNNVNNVGKATSICQYLLECACSLYTRITNSGGSNALIISVMGRSAFVKIANLNYHYSSGYFCGTCELRTRSH